MEYSRKTTIKKTSEKVVILHKNKKPTIVLNDWVDDPKLIFDSDKYGPSFSSFQLPDDVKLRNTKLHSFVETIMLCYMHHLPLTLSPDDVWATIIQGFGLHMEKNS